MENVFCPVVGILTDHHGSVSGFRHQLRLVAEHQPQGERRAVKISLCLTEALIRMFFRCLQHDNEGTVIGMRRIVDADISLWPLANSQQHNQYNQHKQLTE